MDIIKEEMQDSDPVDIESYKELGRVYLETLLKNDRHGANKLVLMAVERGMPLQDIYIYIFQESQHEIGRLWESNRITVAQEHYCTAATQNIMSQLYPYIFSTKKIGRLLVATCVGGELHELGARMVADFFEMAGWDTYYLGANTPSESIIKTLESLKADLLAISVSMTFNVAAVKNLIADIRASLTVKGIRILVGGRPFNVAEDLWRTVKADGFAPDAKRAVEAAEVLLASP